MSENDPRFTASRALISAALAGLVCAAPGCSSKASDEDNANGKANATPDAGVTADAASVEDAQPTADTGTPSDASAAADAEIEAETDATSLPDADPSSDAGAVDAAIVCEAGTDGGVITSSTVVSDMTLEKFTAQCDNLGGTVEIHPHCGGSNSCKGMSYDEGTQLFTEHTCKGLNTCAGYSCVVCS